MITRNQLRLCRDHEKTKKKKIHAWPLRASIEIIWFYLFIYILFMQEGPSEGKPIKPIDK